MNQNNTQAQRIVLWGIAIDPIFLAGICYFLNIHSTRSKMIPRSSEETIIIVFTIISLVAAGLSFKFSSLALKTKFLPGQLPEPFNPVESWPKQIIAIALAIAPGISGFVLSFLFNNNFYLLLFNGGALALAIWHITNFVNAS